MKYWSRVILNMLVDVLSLHGLTHNQKGQLTSSIIKANLKQEDDNQLKENQNVDVSQQLIRKQRS